MRLLPFTRALTVAGVVLLAAAGCGDQENATPQAPLSGPPNGVMHAIALAMVGVDGCVTRANVTVEIPTGLDQRIQAAGGSGFATDWIYAGELTDAAAAFGGPVIAKEDESGVAWIRTTDETGEVAVQLRPHVTEAGVETWVSGDRIRPTECDETPT